MKTNIKKLLSVTTISLGFAIIIGAIAGFFFHVIAADHSIKFSPIIGFILVDIFITIACFFIVRQNPSSIWYVPIICSAYSIIGVIGNPHLLFGSSMGFSFLSGWVLSLIASLIGVLVGKRSKQYENP